MINTYISNLINDLPNDFKKQYKNTSINLVLEGGLFNGSYMTGCLFYLKELEKRKYIHIKKISGCSIGSLIALLYFIENEEIILNIYKISYNHFKDTYNVNIFNKIFDLLQTYLPSNIIDKINNKVYISYYNIKTCKQIIKCKYKNLTDLFETIRRSCSFPFIVDNKIYYKKKYIDGLYPYIFPPNNKERVLYLNIHSLNKIPGMLSVKNETTNMNRVFEGIMEANIFFKYDLNTNICSFTDKWNILDFFHYYIFIFIIHIFVFILNKCYNFQKLIRQSSENNKININRLFYNLYIQILHNYCI
jgi:hypothetical protein